MYWLDKKRIPDSSLTGMTFIPYKLSNCCIVLINAGRKTKRLAKHLHYTPHYYISVSQYKLLNIKFTEIQDKCHLLVQSNKTAEQTIMQLCISLCSVFSREYTKPFMANPALYTGHGSSLVSRVLGAEQWRERRTLHCLQFIWLLLIVTQHSEHRSNIVPKKTFMQVYYIW